MSRFRRRGAIIMGVLLTVTSILIVISGFSLLALSERGTLVDPSGVTPTAESEARIARPRIVFGVVGLAMALAVLALACMPSSRMLLSLAAVVDVGAAVAVTVTALRGSLADNNMLVLIILVFGLVVLSVLVGGLLSTHRASRR